MLNQTDAPYYNYYHLKIVFWEEGNTCHGVYVGGQRLGIGSQFFPSTLWTGGLSSGYQIQWQVPLPLSHLAGPNHHYC